MLTSNDLPLFQTATNDNQRIPTTCTTTDFQPRSPATSQQASAFRERMKAQRKTYLEDRAAEQAREAAPARSARQLFLADRRAAGGTAAATAVDAAEAAADADDFDAEMDPADEEAWTKLDDEERASFERRAAAEARGVEIAAYIATLGGGGGGFGEGDDSDDE